MSSNGPWSVKGIDPRARARAKSAARREGLTLGEWINRVILDSSDPSNPNWDDALEAFPGFGGSQALSEEDDRLLRAMVNRLTERVESSEKMSARTLNSLDKAITQLADKITKTGERQSAELANAQKTIERVRKNQAELNDRVRTLETKPGGGSGEDVRAVETTIMKLARRLYEHENDTAARIHAVDEDTKSLSQTLEERLARLESRNEDHAERDRRRDDETVRTLSSLQTATETLKARVESAERLTNEAARALENSVSRLDDRMRQLETRNSSDTVELERRFERLSDDVARIIAETRAQVAQAVSGAASEPRIDRLEDALTRALGRMDDAERRQGDSMSRLGREITKLAGAIDRRLSESERRTAEALRESQSESKLDRRVDEVRQESREAIRRMGEEVTRLGRSLADRIEKSEHRASTVVETATDRMAEMIDKFDSHRQAREEDLEERLRQSEERTAKRIEDALGSVQERMAAVRSETEEALSPVQRAMVRPGRPAGGDREPHRAQGCGYARRGGRRDDRLRHPARPAAPGGDAGRRVRGGRARSFPGRNPGATARTDRTAAASSGRPPAAAPGGSTGPGTATGPSPAPLGPAWRHRRFRFPRRGARTDPLGPAGPRDRKPALPVRPHRPLRAARRRADHAVRRRSDPGLGSHPG